MAKEAKEPSESTPAAAPQAAAHDLMDAEAARQLLKMPAAKFELLISTGQVRVFRSDGQPCFRREDIAALALKRQAAPAKSAAPRKVAPPAAAPAAPGAPAAKSSPRSEAMKPPAPKATPSIPKPSEPDDMEEEEFEEPPPPAPRQKSRAVSRFLLPAAIVIAIIAFAWTFNTASKHSELPIAVPPPAPGAFANSKAAPGLIESVSGERPLSFEVGGKIHAVLVEEGQSVNVGDTIAELENADLNAKLKSSQADLSAAEAKLGMLNGNLESDLKKSESEVARLKAEILLLEPRKEDIERARAETAATEADCTRLTEDAKRNADIHAQNTGAVPQQLVDQTKRLAEAAAAKCNASKAQLHALEAGSRPEEKDRLSAMLASAEAEVSRQKTTSAYQIQSVQAQVDQSKAQVELVKADLQKTRIVSASSGTVVRKYMHPGEVIDALHPQPVVTVADLTQLRVRADVDEADFPGISVGQRVPRSNGKTCAVGRRKAS